MYVLKTFSLHLLSSPRVSELLCRSPRMGWVRKDEIPTSFLKTFSWISNVFFFLKKKKAFRELHSLRAIGKVLAWTCNYSEIVNLTKLKRLIFQKVRKSFWGFTGLQLEVCWSGLLCWWRMRIHAELVDDAGQFQVTKTLALWRSAELPNTR